MPQLMCQRESVVQGIGVVEQDKGVYAIDTGGICARGLALVFVDVDPVFVEGAVRAVLYFSPSGASAFLTSCLPSSNGIG